ncbi:MAG TPA: prepilin-type N-terminal cleavage/methylation domain-containing protein [Planctomycetota bacterium]|jgi:type II secretion system protein H|nr:prepilin-type N-terminal cleavage/methylation domain-containing protein [Planctomycetota bacterium]
MRRGGTALLRRARSGFSMIEILAVLVILGLIAAIVSMNWQALLPRTELHSAVRILASTIQGAHSESIARNAIFKVEYDLDKHRYRVNTPFRLGGGLAANDDERMTQSWIDLPKSVHFSKVQIDGVDYSRGMVFVRFDPLGAASGHIITLEQQPYKNYYTIEVQALTGMIDYHEGLFERAVPREDDFK